MGIDVRVLIHKKDLKLLELWEIMGIYEDFIGRWEYCIKNRFAIEGNETKITLKELKEHITFSSSISQNDRDKIKILKDLNKLAGEELSCGKEK